MCIFFQPEDNRQQIFQQKKSGERGKADKLRRSNILNLTGVSQTLTLAYVFPNTFQGVQQLSSCAQQNGVRACVSVVARSDTTLTEHLS